MTIGDYPEKPFMNRLGTSQMKIAVSKDNIRCSITFPSRLETVDIKTAHFLVAIYLASYLLGNVCGQLCKEISVIQRTAQINLLSGIFSDAPTN